MKSLKRRMIWTAIGAIAVPVLRGGDLALSDGRYQHHIDVAPVIGRFLAPDGFIDPEFPPTIAEPSPHLTDFFGVQAVADVSRDEIVADFVPRFAELSARDEHSVTLTFKDGFTATFYPVSSLVVMGFATPVSHVVVSGDTWRQARGNVETLIGRIREIGRAGAYLLENPDYGLEMQTYETMRSGQRASVEIDPDLSRYRSSADGLLLFPEAVHGISTDADALMKVIDGGGFDWLGMEALNLDQQDDLDAFNNAAAGTPEYVEARAVLVEYFADAWNGRAGPRTTGEENYYFKLCEAAHAAGARVIALEGASLPFLFFRYGETKFGASVRSLIWANAIPSTGRGILFGGGAHFHYPDVPMVQDFVAAESPQRPIFAVRDLWAKAN
ncbi:MAG: hypothetical protein OXF94_10280 [Gammaproteobacteria bacterium]|nr:hypothetical protein [Gammaproteobacteria bacterium]